MQSRLRCTNDSEVDNNEKCIQPCGCECATKALGFSSISLALKLLCQWHSRAKKRMC